MDYSYLSRNPLLDTVLVLVLLVLAVLLIVTMIRSVLGPKIADRIVSVNMIGTMVIMMIAILSVYLDEAYLVDVCLIYAMISFLGVVVLCKVYTGVYLQRKQIKADLGAVEDNLSHQEHAELCPEMVNRSDEPEEKKKSGLKDGDETKENRMEVKA
jgi:multicomponent Na+:H+ antiporter subunit F